MFAMTRVWLTGGVLAALSGCGGNDEKGDRFSDTTSPSQTTAGLDAVADSESDGNDSGKTLWEQSLGTATVGGVVRFAGPPPRRRTIDMASRADCARLQASPVLDETVIVGPQGTLKNVLVWVKSGLRKWRFPTPDEPVFLDQRGCMFDPHVVAVQVGQDVLIRNSDPCAHNVHAVPTRNQPFNFTQGQAGAEDVRTFSRPELMAYIKCDIHGWMSAYVNVMPHPFFAVTQEDGVFLLPKLPPGDYMLEAQHEFLGKRTVEITVVDGEVKNDVEFSFGDESPQ